MTIYKLAVGITNAAKKEKINWLDVEQIVSLNFVKKTRSNDLVFFKLKKKLKFSDSVRLEINMTVIIGIIMNENQSNIAIFFHRYSQFVGQTIIYSKKKNQHMNCV